MPFTQSICARSYAGLLDPARPFIREQCRAGEMLILGPSREAADALARSACDGAAIGIHRFGWREWVMAASERRASELDLLPVRRLAREALAARTLRIAKGNHALDWLSPVADCRGTPRALSSTLEDLRLNRIRPERLRTLGPTGADLAVLLELYERELSERRYADHAIRVELATESLDDPRSRFAGMPLLALDLAMRTVSERALVEQLCAASSASLTLTIGRDTADVRDCLSSVQRYLFSGEDTPEREADASFGMFSASGEALECVEIARRIRSLRRFDRCAIVLRDPNRYQPLVAEALRRAGIPAHFTRGTRNPHPAGRAFVALLRCAEEGLSASRFAEYVSLGHVPEDEDFPRAPYRWEKVLVDAAVIGGKDRWKRRLAGLLQELANRDANASEQSERDHCARQSAAIRSLEEFAMPIIERLDTLPHRATWGAWIESLSALATEALDDSQAVTVNELLALLEPLSDVGPVDLGDVLLILETELTERRIESADSRYGKVWVSTIDEAAGLSFDVVFVPGVNESVFPKPSREDPLLLESKRAQLELPARIDDSDLLHIAAACASKRLQISYSRLDLMTGRQQVPSFFAFEAFKAARGSNVDIEAFRAAVEQTTGSRLGWPAPQDAADAIDDVEFDLATLHPAIESGGAGQGAYLITANAVITRSLKHRFRRWEKKEWTSADGMVYTTVHDLDVFSQFSPVKTPYSPSTLQDFARCPYRFALRGLVGLREPERPAMVQRMDPLTRGQIIHSAQAELHRRLHPMGLLPIHPEQLSAVYDVLDEIVTKLREVLTDQLAPAIPQIWEAEWNQIHADLKGWVLYKSQYDGEWTPEYFEWGFGLRASADRDRQSAADPIDIEGGYKLKGAIDLIERHANGQLRIVDHKTGKPPSEIVRSIGRGERLQPALYAIAAAAHFREPVACGRFFYSTLRGNYAVVDVPLDLDVREAVRGFFDTLDSHIEKGFLPAAPREDACLRCEFIPVCGPWEEDRVRRKSTRELSGLRAVRDAE